MYTGAKFRTLHTSGRVILGTELLAYRNVFRIILFTWYGDASPTVSSIIDNIGGMGYWNGPFHRYSKDVSAAVSYYAPYKVHFDKRFIVDAQDVGNDYAPNQRLFKWSTRIPSNVSRDETTGIPIRGNTFLLFISDSGAVPNPTVEGVIRTTFVDY
jgi:hypothetical protein